MNHILAAVEEVRRERVRGASWSMSRLARAVIEDHDSGSISCGDIDRVASSIVSANRTMAPLYNLANLLHEGCKSGKGMGDIARRVLWYIDEARKMLYTVGEHAVPEGASVATLSYSIAVETVLMASKPSMVYVAESLPGGEGIEFARSLRRSGKPVSLVPDSMIPRIVESSDIVMVGADAVTFDPCLFNKVGSLAAALAASRFSKPFIPVFESFKIHPSLGCSSVEVEVRYYRVEGWGDVPYNLFDRVEGDLVSGAVTEHGVTRFTPEDLKRPLYKFYELILGE